MDIVLWIIQVALGVAYAAACGMKLGQARDRIVGRITWAKDFTDPQVRAIGALEGLGALGVTAAAASASTRFLVPLAALGLALLMIGAVGYHVRHGDASPQIAPALILFVLAAFVAVLRFGPYPL